MDKNQSLLSEAKSKERFYSTLEAFPKNTEEIRRLTESILSNGTVSPSLAMALAEGKDPLGDIYMNSNSPEKRRANGSTYTPLSIVKEMVEIAKNNINPSLIVDCGCGSGRYSLLCANFFPNAKILSLDNSDDALSMCKANVLASNLSSRIDVRKVDFTNYEIKRPNAGSILWIGNPPYVRHHDIDPSAKERLKTTAEKLGFKASRLSGLHVHFLASIAKQWKDGDYGVLITSSEWMDNNYGSFMRELLSKKLDLNEIRLFDRKSKVFETAETTAVIIAFGKKAGIVNVQNSFGIKKELPLSIFQSEKRWTRLVDSNEDLSIISFDKKEDDFVPLGTLVHVHRGLATGNNKFWVRKGEGLKGIPDSLTVPIVSHAKEIMGECISQSSPEKLSHLIVLPEDIHNLTGNALEAAHRILSDAESKKVNSGYIAAHRKKWWSIKPPSPPAVFMTYMGRGKPTFVVNKKKLPMLNVVHGLYPKIKLTPKAIERLVSFLNDSVDMTSGRTYCGGLVKFEPREVEAIMVPSLRDLEA